MCSLIRKCFDSQQNKIKKVVANNFQDLPIFLLFKFYLQAASFFSFVFCQNKNEIFFYGLFSSFECKAKRNRNARGRVSIFFVIKLNKKAHLKIRIKEHKI